MATHFNILAWEIPWIEEPGRLQSMGLRRVAHNLATKQGFPGGLDGKESACSTEDLLQSLGWEDSLKKEMATYCSILAWRIPWTEEPGRLPSMGSQRVRQD